MGFGTNTTSYDVFFAEDNPPMTKVVDDVSTGGGMGTYDPGTMTAGTTYYWYVVDRNTQNEIAGPVWSFSTDCGHGLHHISMTLNHMHRKHNLIAGYQKLLLQS